MDIASQKETDLAARSEVCIYIFKYLSVIKTARAPIILGRTKVAARKLRQPYLNALAPDMVSHLRRTCCLFRQFPGVREQGTLVAS